MIPTSAKQEIIEINNYRKSSGDTDSFGVIYTQEQIFEYVKPGGYFDKLVSGRPALPEGSSWSVGFLFKKTIVDGIEKLSFSVVPLACDAKSNTVVDRIDGKVYPTHETSLLVGTSKANSTSKSDEDEEEDEDFSNTGNIFP